MDRSESNCASALDNISTSAAPQSTDASSADCTSKHLSSGYGYNWRSDFTEIALNEVKHKSRSDLGVV